MKKEKDEKAKLMNEIINLRQEILIYKKIIAYQKQVIQKFEHLENKLLDEIKKLGGL